MIVYTMKHTIADPNNSDHKWDELIVDAILYDDIYDYALSIL